MSDNVSEILYGKTTKLKLADGKEYRFREPSLFSLKKSGISITEITKVDMSKLAYASFVDDNPGVKEDDFMKLVTFQMLTNDGGFLRSILDLYGLSPEKNESGE